MQQVTTRGIDVAKHVFELHGVNGHGKIVLPKRLSRHKVLSCIATLPARLIDIEASGGTHDWARAFTKLGHEVNRTPPQYVKPYVQGNKKDANDAAAICEAVSRPRMRFVPITSVAHQDMQALHHIRERHIKMRTALVNHMRGLLSAYSTVVKFPLRTRVGPYMRFKLSIRQAYGLKFPCKTCILRVYMSEVDVDIALPEANRLCFEYLQGRGYTGTQS